jgi:hypothetical protein
MITHHQEHTAMTLLTFLSSTAGRATRILAGQP